jgi:hypothetical protein
VTTKKKKKRLLCLSLLKEEFGRKYIAKRNLKVGDVNSFQRREKLKRENKIVYNSQGVT